MKNLEKTNPAYAAMSADSIHVGHLNIIDIEAKYGKVSIGLHTDRAIASYKSVPIIEYKHRHSNISSIKNVDIAISQETHDYVPNLKK